MKITKVAAAASMVLVLAMAGCSSSPTSPSTTSTSSGAANAPLTITVLPKNLGNPYFDTSMKGFTAAAPEIGATVTQVGPTSASANGQVTYIQTATQQKVSAIDISSNDPTAMCNALNAAMAAGIKVVTFDSDAPTCRDLFINQASADGIAKVLVQMISDEIGGSGEIAILSAAANATNQNTWIDLMKTDLAASYPNITLDEVAYGNDDDQMSFDQTSALLQKYPNLKGIIAPTTVGIAAAARYLSTSSAKGQVQLTGLGTPNDMRSYVQDGTCKEFALWNPQDLGYLAAYATQALVNGTITGAQGDTFTAGSLGSFTVGADKTVLLGDPYKFDASNIANFNF
ncbi:MAG: rhamnose ABC transporter substrate-binding protein [Propionibacteriaceae bacterium]|nr:rhamnose ABC transporter substrate-binding protein [Propionibacteriaceae bacterium]